MNDTTRRGFIKGTLIASAALASAGLVGCGPQDSQASVEGEGKPSAADYTISEEMVSDVVVVGAGNSGLTAAVQAAELGAKVILLEVNQVHGINTEGLFAVNSEYQKEQGIDVTMAEIVKKEESFFNYRVNALFWKDMISKSAENIDWLKEKGVQFSGQVDNYHDLGHIPVFHWFVDGKGSNLTDPLEAAALDLGVEIFYETRGRELIKENDTIVGIYAEKSDGSYIKISTDAVILATGGFIGDAERMASLNIPEEDLANIVIGRVGDGINMAVGAGAEDQSKKACFLREASFIGKGWLAPLPDFTIYSGTPIWVNENGERFADELCSQEASGCVTNAHYTQLEKYALWGQAGYDSASDKVKEEIETALSDSESGLLKFDTLNDLCEHAGFEADRLSQTVEEYNEYVGKGIDESFGKDAEVLVKIDAPYYFGRFTAKNMQSIGGIKTNREMEVLDPEGQSILGLYAVGTDSCMLYGETYTISVPASCNGNNINSGRTAAIQAVSYISQ